MKVKNKFLSSFKYAFFGVSHALRTQRNMRFHFSAAMLVSLFSYFYELDRVQWVALLCTITFVIVCEMINTAIESTVDVAINEYDFKAKIAKDVAAGAVMISAVLAILVGCFLFLDIERLAKTILIIVSNSFYLSIFIIAVLADAFWIFGKKD